MKTTSAIWTAVLTISALVMATLLLLPQQPAQAAMINAQPGYALLTAGTPGGDEFLVVIDRVTEKMVVYRQNGNNIEIMATQNISKMFK